ncbi:3'(2'),5'-bisphosphate nucleotidase CysQ [Aliikangiella sp. G2MR2-5]|uniref:3'(2'),5'-bisphosphate nucleotidase CysQ n=1 Tax=Aliikangiella sp. G2MR2-5 TaxID=2788943 RepID=UPI0018AC3446|nr:3'(2'),5'-bisphosphate nucleotidase CysQ [Aliikangiella sp. G2MR2-5]
MSSDLTKILQQVCEVAINAGKVILPIYQSDNFEVESKQDNTPLTRADLASHHIIIEQLNKLYPSIPCLSEEGKEIQIKHRKDWPYCFIIDPLDGTKEFIDKNGEFSVNIALVKKNKPILGVIYAPVKDVLYFAAEDVGAFKRSPEQESLPIRARQLEQSKRGAQCTVLMSRRSSQKVIENICRQLDEYEIKMCGSALKMCLIAEGVADLYPKLGPTCEWDTAAAQVILEQAGGRLVDLHMKPLLYNTKESLINPYFIAFGDSSFEWQNRLNFEVVS